MPSEKRRHGRAASPGIIAVSYADLSGVVRYVRAEILDLSSSGCKLVLPHKLSVRGLIKIDQKPNLIGMASVRFQRQIGKGYVTGLEFVGGLRGPAENQPAG